MESISTKMRIALLIAIWNCGTFAANSEIESARLIVSSDETELHKNSARMSLIPDDTGFEIRPYAGIYAIGDPIAAESPNTKPVTALESGQFVTICFAVSKNMNIKIINQGVDGEIAQIYPDAFGSTRVSKELEYCLGSHRSALTLQVPSTPGLGRIYISGTTQGDPPSLLSVPGARDSTAKKRGLSEAWLEYRILPNE